VNRVQLTSSIGPRSGPSSHLNSPIQPNSQLPDLPPAVESDHPNVRFWRRSQWKAHNDKHKGVTDPTSNVNAVRGKTAVSQGENVATLYVEDENGQPVDGHRLTSIRQLARKIWNKFADIGQAPPSWGKANMNFTNEYRREMCRQFPEFRLCENNWKAELLATENYSSWYSNRFGSKAKKDSYRTEKRKKGSPTRGEVDLTIKKQKVMPISSEGGSTLNGNGNPENGASGRVASSSAQPDVASVHIINLGDETPMGPKGTTQDDTSASSLSNRTGTSGEAAPWSGVTPSVNGIRLVEKSVESVRPQVTPLNVRNSRYPIRRVGRADALMANVSCSFLTSLYVDSYSIRARKNHQLNFITITYQMKGSRHLNVNIRQRYTLPAPTHNLMCKQIHSNDKLKTRRPWHQEQP